MIRTTAILAAFLFPAIASAADLVVEIDAVRNEQGQIRAALYDDAGRFLKPDGQVAAVAARPVAGSMTVRFTNLVPGTYAVALYHDENGNEKLDSNLIGIPQEGTGFSRNGRASFGPPDFDDVALRIEASEVYVTPAKLSY